MAAQSGRSAGVGRSKLGRLRPGRPIRLLYRRRERGWRGRAGHIRPQARAVHKLQEHQQRRRALRAHPGPVRVRPGRRRLRADRAQPAKRHARRHDPGVRRFPQGVRAAHPGQCRLAGAWCAVHRLGREQRLQRAGRARPLDRRRIRHGGRLSISHGARPLLAAADHRGWAAGWRASPRRARATTTSPSSFTRAPLPARRPRPQAGLGTDVVSPAGSACGAGSAPAR